MTYTQIGWQDGSGGGTPLDAANLAHMDAGISTNDTAINGSQTPSESATPAASGPVATLLSFIVSQLKLITGGAHWYSAPSATLASLLASVNSNASAISSANSAIAGKLANDGGLIYTSGGGTLTVVTYNGPISIDVESGGQTVMRPQIAANSLVIQVNGHNWFFQPNGILLLPSGHSVS